MSLFTEFETFISSTVWPFLKNVGKSAVKAEANALEPIATKLVASAESAVIAAAASGSTAQLGTVLGKLITDTAAQAETTAITAGATSLLVSVGAALASNPNTALNLAPAQPAAGPASAS